MFIIRFLLLSLLICLSVVSLSHAQAQAPATSTAEPPKVAELLRLLEDADVKTWLAQRQAAVPEKGAAEVARVIDDLEARSRTRLNVLLSAVPRVGSEVYRAASSVRQEAHDSGFAPGILMIGIIAGIGFCTEWFLRRSVPAVTLPNQLLSQMQTEFAPLLIFTATVAFVFLIFPWPPLMRVVVLYSLVATVAYRSVLALCRLAMTVSVPMAKAYPRVRLFVAVLAAAMAFSAICERLAVAEDVCSLIAIGFSGLLLLIAIEAIGRNRSSDDAQLLGRRVPRTTGIAGAVTLWLLWCGGFLALFWLGIMFVVVPRVLSIADKLTHAFAASRWNDGDATDPKTVLLVRGARAIIIIIAVDWIAFVWRHNFQPITGQLALAKTIITGAFNSVVILLVIDLVWQLGNAYIGRQLGRVGDGRALTPNEIARQGRLRTLLPVFRNALAAGLLSVAALTVLSQMGVQIGPLIAGAGVVGVAIGFGSQTLVKDIVSGVFYLLDDAFRVGEYIEAGSYTGTVESFSLRSVRLRHHRGPIFTVPFGSLGAIKNLSRDWSVDKFRIRVPFKTDLDKVRKLIKAIGGELQADPELGSSFIEPLKLKGVEQIGEYGIELGVGFTCKPGDQTAIRRKAYTMLMQVFGDNGIDFAQPVVQVSGDDKGSAAAAHATRQLQGTTAPPGPNGPAS
ncbi:mechanosensitive ion channel protein [Ensifer sp. NM-2]|uniref:mechanosensitive ion channel family protein n=1 Tax=Ensifer sp. NM-2 TaxID=2109730 RepID=UPI000D1199B2|nr:mechanosensitive ion channel domain-containing protein [Ensifer sp. NM-2]PSS66131.1 mechanosensitive ion channel protein [Ensifer sp. NM-2]